MMAMFTSLPEKYTVEISINGFYRKEIAGSEKKDLNLKAKSN